MDTPNDGRGNHVRRPRRGRAVFVGAGLSLLVGIAGVVTASAVGTGATTPPDRFSQTNLVANQASFGAKLVDPNLTNAWGLAAGPNSPLWVSDNNSGKASVYSGGVNGSAVSLDLTVPVPGGNPTGQVYNPTSTLPTAQQAFQVGGPTGSPADFIVSSDSIGSTQSPGEISAWDGGAAFVTEDSPTGGPGGTTPAGAVFKGLALATTPKAGPEIFATDVANATVDVFDRHFAPVSAPSEFKDPAIPAGDAPFGIQLLAGKLYVTYGEQNATKTDVVRGAGLGYVDVYSVNGVLLKHLVAGGASSPLDAPWGLAIAPKNFGPFGSSLLVGNLGNGWINAFDPSTGAFLGVLDGTSGYPVTIPGLWGLRKGTSAFGGGGAAGLQRRPGRVRPGPARHAGADRVAPHTHRRACVRPPCALRGDLPVTPSRPDTCRVGRADPAGANVPPLRPRFTVDNARPVGEIPLEPEIEGVEMHRTLAARGRRPAAPHHGAGLALLALLAMLPLTALLLDAAPASALGVNQYPVSPAPSVPGAITFGPDGDLWFTDQLNNAIGRIIPGAGTVTEYGIPTANSGVSDIALGSDGNLWFTENTADKVGMIDPMSPSTPVEYQVPTSDSGPSGIAAGADGDLWFTENTAGQIGQFSPTDPSAITETPIPGCSNCEPVDISAGPDKNLWFTEDAANKIGRLKPSSHGIVQFKAGPKFGHPISITAGPGGDIWFIEYASENSVDIVQAMTTSGMFGPSVSISYTDGCCADIAPGPDGDIWVPEEGGNNDVLQFDKTGGFVSATPIPSSDSVPGGITAGPDGNIWFTDSSQGTDGIRGNIDEIKLPNLNLLNVLYLPNRFFVPNEVTLPQQGDTANWLGLNPKSDSITDSSGMGLFGSQDSPSAFGSTYSFAFTAAGTYSYRGGAGGTGKVAVPITVQQQPGSTDAAQVTWASASPPGGFAFDVEVKTPGSHLFTSWLTGATATSGTLGPGSGPYTGPGRYQFRSRIRNTGSGASSGYSLPASITLG